MTPRCGGRHTRHPPASSETHEILRRPLRRGAGVNQEEEPAPTEIVRTGRGTSNVSGRPSPNGEPMGARRPEHLAARLPRRGGA